ncbi:MAG: Membrane protein [Candidatus Peregrinibacteria bacterium GW2011_GWA2_33_10]|nr:MAG: Membrane protein [Candidatus Peregrinibacteria bacterium GW2011_GWA2_33_10]KKP40098.1 MAG: O-antigen polymerase [Candidatus Peregrinibacteria bacterium GW2011_GWC2_33_13]OGJ48284.1 MAG: hypothetical protein A2229_04065 [Candidatus Peregrinibacteria bacterium RIFOXYA2_FULL_33_7]
MFKNIIKNFNYELRITDYGLRATLIVTIILALSLILVISKPLLLFLILAATSTLLLFRAPYYGLILTITFTIFGELARVPLGPENGFLINDIFLPFLIIIWGLRQIIYKKELPKPKLLFPFILFTLWAFISFFNGSKNLNDNSEIIVSFSYLIRFISYFFLYYLTLQFPSKQKKLLTIILISGLLLAILGYLQFIFFPDFSEMSAKFGWDPHQYRLLSTWFDPNFIGGFFAFILSIIGGLYLYEKEKSKKLFYIIIAGILLGALFLTYSRSAYLAFAVSFFILGLIKSRQLIIIGTLALVIFTSFSSRAQERIFDFYNSAKALLSSGTEILDPTAQMRLESWQNSQKIIQKYPILGTGFNTLKYVQHEEGIIPSTTVHHASGADSSLLTIFMTTGIIGIIFYLIIYLKIIITNYKTWRSPKTTNFKKGLSLGFLCAISGLLIHSFFVNSLLFSPILVYFWTITAISEE